MRRRCYVEKYVNTEYHFVRNSGGLSGKELAKLSDDELAEYLRQDSILQEKKKYRINPDFILREIAGEYTIIPIGGNNVFSNAVMAPNETAVFLWEAFQQPSTIQDVVVEAMQKYDVTEEQIYKSISNFVKQSLEFKVLEEVV
ncbi:PqqD family protein [Mediterraneibacter catenae]|uniref:PqqD family protein n=1 Tax=Mediterraneibacter catenae TaxID=2594882 RepID=A0A5M9HVP3_9FIRM|nr:PqqD family protein [Mediterraneibacter catenae]